MAAWASRGSAPLSGPRPTLGTRYRRMTWRSGLDTGPLHPTRSSAVPTLRRVPLRCESFLVDSTPSMRDLARVRRLLVFLRTFCNECPRRGACALRGELRGEVELVPEPADVGPGGAGTPAVLV